MADRPIIFSAPMIRALLDGRKTQTRRIIKPSPEFCGGGRSRDPQNWNDPDAWGWENYDEGCWDLLSEGYTGRPFYAPGDRLWVKEAWRFDVEWDDCPPREFDGADAIHYDADGSQDTSLWGDPFRPGRLRSPIHMPRWASRLTLLVTDVRVQRVQEISRGDAMEEGCPFANMADGPNPRDWYRDLWNSIHGTDAWDRNPWVAAISFKAHRCNIDTMEEGTW
jgi:hypothetical protein